MSRKHIVLPIVAFLTLVVVAALTLIYLKIAPKQYRATSMVILPTTAAAKSMFDQDLCLALAKQLRRLKADEDLMDGPMIIDDAREAKFPSKPDMKMVLLFSCVLGISLILGLTSFISRRL